MKTYLVTGGVGFIGSNLIDFILRRYSDCRVVNLDALTYAADLRNIDHLRDDHRHILVHGNICNRELVRYLLKEYDVDAILHLAAESHVDNSIRQPDLFVQTNVIGTHSLLDEAYRYWFAAPFQPRHGHRNQRFLHVSTDEVYGSLGETGLFKETTAYAPNSPYSASKASSDLIVRSYYHTFGLNVVTTNCSNNYGPRQHSEKFIPTIIRNALLRNPIPIYGDGKNVRDWLYVEDHCLAILNVLEKGVAGETYNIGGGNEHTNIEIANRICRLLDELKPLDSGSYADQIQYVADRPGHDRRYAIDATKIRQQLSWQPVETFDSGLRKTVQWYLDSFSRG